MTTTPDETKAALKFGDPVENIAASADNPVKRGFFVRRGYNTGRMNAGAWIEYTDGKGQFAKTPPDNIRTTPQAVTGQGEKAEAALAAIDAYEKGPYTASDVFMELHLETIKSGLRALLQQQPEGEVAELKKRIADFEKLCGVENHEYTISLKPTRPPQPAQDGK